MTKQKQTGTEKGKGQENKAHIASAKALNLPISTKHSVEISHQLRYKNTTFAKQFLEKVAALKEAVPYRRFRRDIGHKKGMSTGRFPQKAAKEFLRLVKAVESNAQVKGLNTSNLKIIKLVSNKAPIPLTGGRQRHGTKRTHIEIEVKEGKETKKEKKDKKSTAKKEEVKKIDESKKEVEKKVEKEVKESKVPGEKKPEGKEESQQEQEESAPGLKEEKSADIAIKEKLSKEINIQLEEKVPPTHELKQQLKEEKEKVKPTSEEQSNQPHETNNDQTNQEEVKQ